MNSTSPRWLASLVATSLSALVHAQLQPPAKLLASDAAPLDQFGRAVALSGDRAIIGAPLDDDLGDASGSAYLFERAGGAWVEVAKLVASDGAAGDRFGWAVAIDGDRALIGAPGPPGVGAFATYTKPGAVYVFERSGSQ